MTKTNWARGAAWAVFSLAWAALPAEVLAVPDAAPASRGLRNPVDRDLQQLREDVERYRVGEEMRRMIKERERREAEPAPKKPAPAETSFRFRLNAVDHNASSVLTAEEIAAVTKKYEGTEVDMAAVQRLLGDINALYRDKGYVVCEARLRPQRIRGGRLFVTLVEGRTGLVKVTGNEHTSAGYLEGAFDLEKGEVANYRDLSADLVHVHMTNDVVLSIDMRAGEEAGTTDYEIRAAEPANWTATVFADTLGTRSTGRPRVGASVTNRSVFGRRDSATLLGLASEGSRSFMAGYSIPLTSRGTRLSANVSVGDVEVIQGDSAELDVTGESEYYSLRLDHPVYADADMKWTVFGEWTRQNSSTDFYDVTINDTRIDSWRTGFETILLGDRSVFYFMASVSHGTVKEYTFDERWTQNIASGNAFWRYGWTGSVSTTLSGAWQAVLGGDPLSTTQYFYLGHTSGVRGYENDVLSAEQGAWVNAQIDWAFAGPSTSLFAFFDAGTLGGTSSYETRSLASAGAGVTWPLWSGASVTGTVGFPLRRHLNDDIHVNRARFDISVTAVW